MILYECNPELYNECKKVSCYEAGGGCRFTAKWDKRLNDKRYEIVDGRVVEKIDEK